MMKLTKLWAKESCVYFCREDGNRRLVVAINMNDERKKIDLRLEEKEQIADIVMCGEGQYLNDGIFDIGSSSGIAAYMKKRDNVETL